MQLNQKGSIMEEKNFKYFDDPSISKEEKEEIDKMVKEIVKKKGNFKEYDEERGTWTNHIEFILSLVGYCIGLGNVWRFPYLCYKNGGGIFLVCYLVAVLVTGIPMFLLEIGIGQYYGSGALTIWKISPIFKGLGYGCVILSLWYNIYGIVVLSWALFYFFQSFTSELPWGSCSNWWNTEHCTTSAARSNMSCWLEGNQTFCFIGSNSTKVLRSNLTDPVVEYWKNRVLQMSEGLDVPGSLNWDLVLLLFLSWVCVYFCIWKGIKWTGKIVYVTSLFPYLLMIVLFFRGVSLPGAAEGLRFYLKPDLSKLINITVWMDAFSQVFHSYSIVFASLIALGSYNKFHNNCFRDTMVICSINSLTSFFAGFVIFSVVGFMAHEQHKPVSEVAASGPGLAFLAYPTAVLHMPMAPFWSAIFFLMLFTLGIDSLFCNLEGIITSISDQWPSYLRKHKELTALAVSIGCFLLGLSCVTQGGIYVFEILNSYAVSGINLLILLIAECIAIGWVYGADRFSANITQMIGSTLNPWFKYCWKFVTPLGAIIVLVLSLVDFRPLKLVDYEYPLWGHLVGLILAMMSVVCIPVYAIWLWCSTDFEGSMKNKWKLLSRPHLETTRILEELNEINDKTCL